MSFPGIIDQLRSSQITGADSTEARVCRDLPGPVWQCIYRHLKPQTEICSGRLVCKLLNDVLPELILTAILKKPAHLLQLQAIQDRSSYLTFLAIRLTHGKSSTVLQGAQDLSLLTFPHLLHLRLRNYPFKSMHLDAAHYPQLRKLVIKRSRQPETPQQLQLQLPHLLTLEFENIQLETAAGLATCLGFKCCPRLRRFCGFNLRFRSTGYDHVIEAEMPWLQVFELEDTDVNTLDLKAPRLMDLSLTDCNLGYVYLEEDERNLDDEIESDVEYDAALHLPEFALDKTVVEVPYWEKADFGQDPATARRCVPFALNRIYLTACDVGDWKRSDNYEDLIKDPRIYGVDDDDVGPGSDPYGRAEEDDYVPKMPCWFLFE